jgi:hypothetical protein
MRFGYDEVLADVFNSTLKIATNYRQNTKTVQKIKDVFDNFHYLFLCRFPAHRGDTMMIYNVFKNLVINYGVFPDQHDDLVYLGKKIEIDTL